MLTILAAIAPNFALILMGWVLRHRHVLEASFWAQAEKLTYYILFPSLLVANLAEAKLDGLPVAEVVGTQALGIVAAVAVLVGVLRPLWRRLRTDGPTFTSVIQGSIRPNTYIGFAAAAGLWGHEGVTLTALSAAVLIPLVNLFCVIGLVRWGHSTGGRGLGPTLLAIGKNPLILACLIGAGLNLTGIGLPPFIGPLLKILGQASLALGLLCVGAGLDFAALRGSGGPLAAALAMKLAITPALVATIGWAFGVHGTVLVATALYSGLPVAANAYILARQMGGEYRLMAAIITASTLTGIVSLPLLVQALTMLP